MLDPLIFIAGLSARYNSEIECVAEKCTETKVPIVLFKTNRIQIVKDQSFCIPACVEEVLISLSKFTKFDKKQ